MASVLLNMLARLQWIRLMHEINNKCTISAHITKVYIRAHDHASYLPSQLNNVPAYMVDIYVHINYPINNIIKNKIK